MKAGEVGWAPAETHLPENLGDKLPRAKQMTTSPSQAVSSISTIGTRSPALPGSQGDRHRR